MNHYDLSNLIPKWSSIEWKEFLTNPKVQQYIQEEMTIIKSAEMNKIVQQASSSKSMGQAQLLNSLDKLSDDDATANGPIFIYCHVPLNEEQKHAPNVMKWIEEDSSPTI